MNNKQQGADDFIEELLGRAQASTSGANVLHESQPPFPAVLGASHDVQHNVLKGRQDSLSSQLTDDGNFLNEYFEMDAQTLRGVGNLDSGYPGVLFRGSPNDTADVDRNGEQGDNSENFASSLGSSANSELLSPSGSYYPQRLNSLDSHGYSQYLSSSLRSPSTSLRGNAHQSSSLRGQTLPKRARQSSLSSSIASTPVLEDGLVGSAASGVSNMTQEEKLRRRREFHNAVERRRRELIKTKIKELGKLVPPSLLNYNDEGKEVRLNKGIILRRTVDYLEYLKQVLEVQEHKKLQLQDKIISLEQRRREIEGHPHRPLTSGNHLTRQNPESPEQIIDGRAVPHILKEDPPQNDIRLPLSDDLQQFLSGNQMEQEDNTKLLFNAGTENHASFLLNFDS